MRTIKYYISLFIIFLSLSSYGQNTRLKKEKFPTYFGFQIRPIFGSSLVGQNKVNYTNGNFESLLMLKNGVSYGANVRAGFTKLLALETGINYTKRNFQVNYQYPDSNINETVNFSFVNFDIPLNLLTYIQLSEKYFMNASLGAQIRFNPSSAGVNSNPFGKNEFNHTGFPNYVNIDFNANLGFELRTKDKGFFYLGGSVCIPLQKVFEFYASYAPKSSTQITRASGSYKGSYLALDLKYFFPYRKKESKAQPKGPIE